MGQTVNLVVLTFGGSNPPLPTKLLPRALGSLALDAPQARTGLSCFPSELAKRFGPQPQGPRSTRVQTLMRAQNQAGVVQW